MTPTDRVDALLRETRGSPSAGDLRRMVEEAEADVIESVAGAAEDLAARFGTAAREPLNTRGHTRANRMKLTFMSCGLNEAANVARALARERKP